MIPNKLLSIVPRKTFLLQEITARSSLFFAQKRGNFFPEKDTLKKFLRMSLKF